MKKILFFSGMLILLVCFLMIASFSSKAADEFVECLMSCTNIWDEDMSSLPDDMDDMVVASRVSPLLQSPSPEMMQRKMGRGQGGMCRGHFGMMGMGQGILRLKEELNLTPQQVDSLKSMFFSRRKDFIKKRADIEIAEIELKQLFSAKNPDLNQIETKIRQIEKMKTDARIDAVKTFFEAKKILTPEQVQKLENLKKERFRCKNS